MKGYGPVNAMEFPRFSGIRTFMRLPHVHDLVGVDFAVIGAPFDTGATYRVGARFGPVALIQFDSHGDVWHGYFGGKDTHGTPFCQAAEEGLLDLTRSSQVGLRGPVYDAADIQLSRALGFQVFTASEVREAGLDGVIAAVKARAGNGPCFLTFDIDFVDPAYAPATGTPEVGGFTSWECQYLLRGLTGIHFVAFDLVEVSPPYDNAGETTALLAANLVYEFITLLALARAGA